MDGGVCKYWQASMDKSGDDNVRERLDILVQCEALTLSARRKLAYY